MLAVAMRHARTMLLAALARAAPPPELSTSLNPTFPSTDAVRRPIYGELAARVNGTFGVDYPEARLARALRWRGSDTRLRTALAAAAKNPNRTFVALVLGGSEAAGAQCESEVPGVRRLGLFAYWKQPGRQGGRKSRPDCAWPARLARYLATVETPEAIDEGSVARALALPGEFVADVLGHKWARTKAGEMARETSRASAIATCWRGWRAPTRAWRGSSALVHHIEAHRRSAVLSPSAGLPSRGWIPGGPRRLGISYRR